MADPVTKICDELGVCREEALFYLEGLRWDLNAATEACRSKTLPSPQENLAAAKPCSDEGLPQQKLAFAVQSSPQAPRTLPLTARSNHQPDPEEEKQRNEKIAMFCQFAPGANVDDARLYLRRRNWNLDAAVGDFYPEFNPTADDRDSSPIHSSHDGRTPVSQSSSQMFPGNDLMQDVLSRVPQFNNNLKGVSIREPSSFSPTADDTTETLSEDEGSPTEERKECIRRFLDGTPGASLTAALNCLKACKWDVHRAVTFFESSQVHGSGNPTRTTEENLSSEREQSNEKLITSFQEMASGASRQVAIDFLTHYKWDVQKAINYFLDGMAISLPEDINVPLPSESQFESSYVSQSQDHLKEGGTGSSSRPINAVPRSVIKAGEGDVTVAIPGMASYQADGKAVEEESSADPLANQDRTTVVTQTEPDTITVTVIFADKSGTSVELPFRPNQTVRDIRNAIDERAPDNDRGYFLQSTAGVDYKDLNITVFRIASGGSTTLLQTFPGP